MKKCKIRIAEGKREWVIHFVGCPRNTYSKGKGQNIPDGTKVIWAYVVFFSRHTDIQGAQHFFFTELLFVVRILPKLQGFGRVQRLGSSLQDIEICQLQILYEEI
jgi:hypothetical protein